MQLVQSTGGDQLPGNKQNILLLSTCLDGTSPFYTCRTTPVPD